MNQAMAQHLHSGLRLLQDNVAGQWLMDAEGLNSGWQSRGGWTVPVAPGNVAPAADSVSPASGTGASQTFTFTYSDANGYTDINAAYALFNSSLNAADACYVFYY